MPLILTCGYPCSGKSTVVQLLVAALQQKYPAFEFLIIPEPAALTSFPTNAADVRSEIYADSLKERELRGHHKSEVERALSSHRTNQRNGCKQIVVFMDAPNYIKGYRYELYCLAKSLKHSHLVLFFDTPSEKCRQWNKQVNRYPDELLIDLIARFETPQPSQRWDRPLITVRPDSWSDVNCIDVSLVLLELDKLIFTPEQSSAVKPNRSTQLSPILPTDFLQELERATQQIIDHIIHSQSMGFQSVQLPPSLVANQSHQFGSPQLSLLGRETQFSVANLARAKRRYIAFQRAKLANSTVPPNVASAAEGFWRFLTSSERISDSSVIN